MWNVEKQEKWKEIPTGNRVFLRISIHYEGEINSCILFLSTVSMFLCSEFMLTGAQLFSHMNSTIAFVCHVCTYDRDLFHCNFNSTAWYDCGRNNLNKQKHLHELFCKLQSFICFRFMRKIYLWIFSVLVVLCVDTPYQNAEYAMAELSLPFGNTFSRRKRNHYVNHKLIKENCKNIQMN